MNNRGNKEAMEQGFFDWEEAAFVAHEAGVRLGMDNAEAAVEHGSWFVIGEINGEMVTYAVHATTGVESITFEEI